MYMFYKCRNDSDVKIGQKFKYIKQGEFHTLKHLNEFKDFYSVNWRMPHLIEVWRGNKLVKELKPVLENGEYVLRKTETIRFF